MAAKKTMAMFCWVMLAKMTKGNEGGNKMPKVAQVLALGLAGSGYGYCSNTGLCKCRLHLTSRFWDRTFGW